MGDCEGDPCKNFVFDFGDGSPPKESTSPIVKHAYEQPGSYPVYVTVTDKFGKKGNASFQQRVIDPKNSKKNLPPIAKLTSDPPESRPNQSVTFDASKSLDQDKKPCVAFLWNFGDNSPQQTTKEPFVKHSYAKPGAYPVTVQVTDKLGQTADASLQQRVSDPALFDNDPSKGPKGPKKENMAVQKGMARIIQMIQAMYLEQRIVIKTMRLMIQSHRQRGNQRAKKKMICHRMRLVMNFVMLCTMQFPKLLWIQILKIKKREQRLLML